MYQILARIDQKALAFQGSQPEIGWLQNKSPTINANQSARTIVMNDKGAVQDLASQER